MTLTQNLQDTAQPYNAQYDSPSLLHTTGSALHESVTRVLNLLVSLLPGLLAFILAVALLTALGIFLSFVIRKLLTSIRFDDRLTTGSHGFGDFSPTQSPTALAGRATFWGCVLLGLIVGTLSFDASYATGSALTLTLLPYLSHTVGAILILFFGNLIARFLARTVLIGAVNNQFQYARFLSIGIKWLVLTLAVAMALEHLRIGGTVIALAFGILFGGIVLTLALAIGLGSRDLVTRSLARTTETLSPNHPSTPPTESLRHF